MHDGIKLKTVDTPFFALKLHFQSLKLMLFFRPTQRHSSKSVFFFGIKCVRIIKAQESVFL